MDFRDRHIVVTGGTGALGGAMVGGLVAAGDGFVEFAEALLAAREPGSRDGRALIL